MIEYRCGLPVDDVTCPRPLGHEGPCRATWHAFPRCGVPMPQAEGRCARRAGHGWGHRSEYALENRRDRDRLTVAGMR